MADANQEKTCIVCGKDCAGQPRSRDSKGNYYHKACEVEVVARRKAELATQAPPPPPPPEPDFDPFGDLGLEPTGGPASGQGGKACPSCGGFMADSVVVCMGCGYNSQSGKSMSTKRSKERDFSKATGAMGMLLSPAGVGLGLAAIFGVLAILATAGGEPTIFAGPAAIATLVIGIFVLLAAFSESTGTGFLCLCIPFYSLYFVYGVSDNSYVKVLFTVSIGLNIISIAIGGALGM